MITPKLMLYLCAATTFAANTFSVGQDVRVLGAGATAKFSARAVEANSALPVEWTIGPSIPGASVSDIHNRPELILTAPSPGANSLKQCVEVSVTATAASGETHTAYITLEPGSEFSPQAACAGGSMVISVLGFEQAGAPSANGSQKFFFDFMQSYPLPIEKSGTGPKANIYGPPWRWWGDLRIGSFPQQVTAPVSQFAAQFGSQWAALPVNKLAQSGDFRIGLERRIAAFGSYFLRAPGALYERTSLGLLFYFGAQGQLSSPAATAQMFNLPTPGTQQRTAFDRAFPPSRYPDLTLTGVSYIGFVPPNRGFAYQQYGAGFRLTTRFLNAAGRMLSAPALISASFGQNEAVTGGARRGIVGTFEAFYPLPLGLGSSEIGAIYLFGRMSLALRRPITVDAPLALTPAPGIAVTNPNVAVIAMPAARDLYTIGVGIDAVEILKGLFNFGKPAT